MAMLASSPALAVPWDDLGDGVCAALCDSSEWSTSPSSSSSSGRSWVSPEEIAQRQERIRQWEEYRTKLAARTAAQKEFRSYIRNTRKAVRKRWQGKPWISMPVQESTASRGSVRAMLGIVANPNVDTIAHAGIDLARPVGIGSRTPLSLDGLRKFAAIIEHIEATGIRSDEAVNFMLHEGAAHMSGHASRISVVISPTAQDMPNIGSGDAFQAAWAGIKKSQGEIRKSEERRLKWAKEVAREEAEIEKLETLIYQASGKKRERLERKREKRVEKISKIKLMAQTASQEEAKATENISRETKKIRVIRE